LDAVAVIFLGEDRNANETINALEKTKNPILPIYPGARKIRIDGASGCWFPEKIGGNFPRKLPHLSLLESGLNRRRKGLRALDLFR
jgi:hypothetical protein